KTIIKSIEFIHDTYGIIKKKVKPNYKSLGKKVGKDMKVVTAEINAFETEDIERIEKEKQYSLKNSDYTIDIDDVQIIAEDVEGWQVATLGELTVALDIQVTDELKEEGIAREFVNRVQNRAKEEGVELADKINGTLNGKTLGKNAFSNNLAYIGSEILAESLEFEETIATDSHCTEID